MTPGHLRLLRDLIDDHGHAMIANAFGVPSEQIAALFSGAGSADSIHTVRHALGRIEVVHRELCGGRR